MRTTPHPMPTSVAVAISTILSGCATRFDSIIPDRRPDYRQSQVRTTKLEVPPDLIATGVDDALSIPEAVPSSPKLLPRGKDRVNVAPASTPTVTPTVLPAATGLRVEQDGVRRWLVISATPEQLWPKLQDFWEKQGLPIKRDEPTIGIMETDWLENRADIPQDGVRTFLKTYLDVLYAAPTRDKFRLRLERAGASQDTALYLSHQGVEEVVVTGGTTASGSNTYRWQNRPADPELEAEMLNRLMVALGAPDRQVDAKAPLAGSTIPAARTQRVEQEGELRLVVNEAYAKTWRLVGLALDGSHYAVEEQQRNQGLYVVEFRDPEQAAQDEGILSKLAFWRNASDSTPIGTRYRVRLADQGAQTIVVVRNKDDQPDNSAGAKQVLDVLQKGLR